MMARAGLEGLGGSGWHMGADALGALFMMNNVHYMISRWGGGRGLKGGWENGEGGGRGGGKGGEGGERGEADVLVLSLL